MTAFADLPLTPDNVEQLVICGYRVITVTCGEHRDVALALDRAEEPGAKPWFVILPTELAAEIAQELALAAMRTLQAPVAS